MPVAERPMVKVDPVTGMVRPPQKPERARNWTVIYLTETGDLHRAEQTVHGRFQDLRDELERMAAAWEAETGHRVDKIITESLGRTKEWNARHE